jgi:hypothetical protein
LNAHTGVVIRRLVFVLAAALIAVAGLSHATPLAARGDANNDGSITLADAIYVSHYLFAKGPAPLPTLDSGDANCDGRIDPLDAVIIVNYVVRGGKRPACPTY